MRATSRSASLVEGVDCPAGHFNDPASTTCVISGLGYQGAESPPGTAELYCREQFVVDGYEVIGTDPDFPAGY